MTGTNGKKNNEINRSTNSTIILFDSTSDLNELMNIIQERKPLAIITFDYDSHKILLNKKIQHEISDDYINENDLHTIQKTSYVLTKWYDEQLISNLLEYQGINLGSLFYAEFQNILIPFLKKFVEFSRIFQKYGDVEFITSPTLYEITTHFTPSVIRFKKIHETSYSLLHDTLKVYLNLGKNSFSVNIPRSYYLKIKKISEKIVHQLFGPKKNTNYEKSVLLVEFDTIKYSKMFSALAKTSVYQILFCRRRPAIWNFHSFSIIRRSNCAVATYHALDNTALQESIKIGLSQITPKINSLWNHQEFFKSFFNINGVSCWDSLKSTFIKLCEKRIMEAIPEIELSKRLLENYNLSSILVWTENGFNEKIIIKLAKKFNIPVVLIQHGGIAYDTTEAYEYNCFAGILPLMSDKFIAWGDVLKQYAINCGIPSKKIEVLGSPIYDKVFEKKINSKNDFILLATTGPQLTFGYDLTVNTMQKYELAIKTICQTVSKMGKKLVIKLHPFQDEPDITNLVREVDPKITIVKQADILSLIEACEVLVTIDVSSTILEAQMLQKPAISIYVKEEGLGNPEVFRSNSCIHTNIDDFENSLNKIINDVNFRKQIINDGNKFVEASLSNLGTASEKIADFVKRF